MARLFAVFAALTLSVALAVAPHSSVQAAALCSNTSTGNTAITDLGTGTYQGEQGGLYPGGSNVPPAAYQSAGVQAARSIVPLDTSGNPSASGNIVFLSIGMSNTSLEFQFFINNESQDSARNPAVAMVNGAEGSQVAVNWINPANTTWTVLEQRLATAGFTDQQVEVLWLKEVNYVRDHPDFESYTHTLTQQLGQITANAAQRYPNLREVFVSARTYGGYSGIYPASGSEAPNPEPYAYESGFANKWFVAQSVGNPAQRPWVGWGPYFWTDGTRGRSDGLTWQCSDTVDGTHPSTTGLLKINASMHSMFTTSEFSPWFRSGGYVPPASPSPAPTAPASAPPTAAASAPPTAAASAPPGAVHQTAQPTAGAHTSPGAGASNPAIGGSPVPVISSPIAALTSSRSPWLPITAILIAIGIIAISLVRFGRRRPGPVGTLPPREGGTPSTAPPNEAAEPPVLAGASPTRDSGTEDGPSPRR